MFALATGDDCAVFSVFKDDTPVVSFRKTLMSDQNRLRLFVNESSKR